MPVIDVIIVFVVVGVLLWLINKFIPMEPIVKQIMNVTVAIFLVLWVLSLFGIFHHLSTLRIG